MANILQLEPDSSLAAIYSAALEQAGHNVQTAGSAQTAIFAADTIKPDVVILELQLTEHSGIEFLYEFRSYADWQNVPVIILSNVPPQEFVHSHQLLDQELGVRTYHYKPQTSLKTLLRSIDEFATITA